MEWMSGGAKQRGGLGVVFELDTQRVFASRPHWISSLKTTLKRPLCSRAPAAPAREAVRQRVAAGHPHRELLEVHLLAAAATGI